jgi:hypothetical protein
MRESEIERQCSLIAEANGWYEIKLMRCNKNGVPDHIYHKGGMTFYVEFKTPIGRLSVDQRRVAQDLKLRGIPVFFINDINQFRHVLMEKFDVFT